MKLIPTIGVLATVIVLGSIGGFYAISYNDFAENNNNPIGAAMFLGNVKVTHFDENGDIIGYRHGTNHITIGGMNIIMGQVFAYQNQTYADRGAGGNNVTGRVSHMQIGYSGEQLPKGPVTYINKLAWNNTDIITPVGDDGPGICKRIRINQGPVNNASAVTWNPGPADAWMPHPANTRCADPAFPATSSRINCAARMNFTAVATFPGASCGDGVQTIDEAGIFTGGNAQGDQMFARNVFGSVVLGNMDTLQLEWEFSFKDALP